MLNIVIKHAYRLTVDLLGMAMIRVLEWVTQDASVYEIPNALKNETTTPTQCTQTQ